MLYSFPSPSSDFSDSSPSDSDSISSTQLISRSNVAAILSSASLPFTISEASVSMSLTMWMWNEKFHLTQRYTSSFLGALITPACSNLSLLGGLGVFVSSISDIFNIRGPKPLSMHWILLFQHGWQDVPIVMISTSQIYIYIYIYQTHLGPPHPTCTQCLSLGN